MNDKIKFDILSLVNSNRHVLGVDHSVILQHLYAQKMDIKTANTYINVLLDEDWLTKNIHSLAAYNLSDKAIIWLNEYKKNRFSFLGMTKINSIITIISTIIGILIFVFGLIKCN